MCNYTTAVIVQCPTMAAGGYRLEAYKRAENVPAQDVYQPITYTLMGRL